MKSIKDCANRIIAGYREVCTMTPHVDCRPEDSSDNAVRLAVHVLSLEGLSDELRLAYVRRDDVVFDKALRRMTGGEK